MEILIRGTKLEITDSMKDYVKEKLSKLDKYLVDQKAKANVLVKVHNYLQKIEVTIPLKTLILRAEEEQQDFYAAVDLVINKLERQIRKNKAKLQKRDKMSTKEFNIDDIIPIEENEKIVKRKKIDVKPMNSDEAILQMELLGHDFYIYKDSETNNVSVIYKRKDGGYGIIEGE
jgi:putative sigma-54 modulation protein